MLSQIFDFFQVEELFLNPRELFLLFEKSKKNGLSRNFFFLKKKKHKKKKNFILKNLLHIQIHLIAAMKNLLFFSKKKKKT